MTEKLHELYSKFFTDKIMPAIMFEGSLVLHNKTLNRILPFVNENSDKFSFYISKQLSDIILEGEQRDFQRIAEFYRIRNANIGKSRKVLSQLENSLKIFEISNEDFKEFTSNTDYSFLYQNLEKQLKDKLLSTYLLEEWMFLQRNSSIVSTLKRVFSIFKSCGAVVVEYSKKAWQQIIEKFDQHVKREFLDNNDNNIITNSLRLRYLGKWIGRNFPEILMLNPQLIFPALGLRAILGFILIDP